MKRTYRPWLSSFIALSLVSSHLPYALANGSNSEAKGGASQAPVRSPVTIKVDLKGLSKGQTEALQSVLSAMGSELTYWSQFPIELPATQFQEGAKLIDLNDLYKNPTSDEADDLAYDSNGDRLRLSPEQLQQLKQEGVVRVASKQYPGMEYVWRVSAIVQEGQKNIEIRLQKDEASGLRHLIVAVPLWLNGTYGQVSKMPISVRGGLRNVLLGLRNVIADVVGLVDKVPSYNSYEVDDIIAKEKAKYVVASVKKDAVSTDFSQIYDEDIMRKAQDVLAQIDEKVKADFEAHRAEIEDPIRAALYKEGEAAVQDALNMHLSEMVLAEIANQSQKFEAINPGLTNAIINRAKAIPIIYEGEQILVNAISQERARVEAEIEAKEPTKSRIPEWLEAQVEKKMKPIIKEVEKQNYEMIAQELEKNQLPDEAKVVRAQFAFMLSQAEQLKKDLSTQTEARELHFPMRTWNSKNWEIQSEQYKNRETGESETYYSAQMYKDAKVVTSTPLWRIWAAWNTSRYILKNGLYHLVVTNLINGPIGIKHVFKKEAFANQKRVNPKTGIIEADPESLTTTVRSRTKALWQSVAEADARFEASQPVGFFNKDIMRVVHKVKNRYIRGYVGTAAIWGCGAVCTLANTVATTGLFATSFVWAPMASIFMMGFDAVVFDTKGASRKFVNRFSPLLTHLVGQAGIKGIGMTVGGALGALTHSAVGVGAVGLGRVRSAIVEGKDALMRQILFRRAYVPKGNDFVTKLVSGPGITSEYYYQVKPEISIMGLMATLEQTELETFRKATQDEINRPMQEFNAFFSQSLGQALALNMDATMSKYPDLTKSTSALSNELNEKVQERNKLYSSILGNERGVNRQLIKQTKEDLATTLTISTSLVKDYFTEKVFSQLSQDQISDFWRTRRLPQNEWSELTKTLLAQTFSSEFLSPLEDSDVRFRFVVENEGLERDLKRVIQGKVIDEGNLIPIVDGKGPRDNNGRPTTRATRAIDIIPNVLIVNSCKRALNTVNQ